MSAPVAPRPPEEVMRLSRMGAAHPTRLSFLRTMMRRLAGEGWRFARTLWEVDASGVGRAVYTVSEGDRAYSLVAFAHDLPDGMRSDRVIATAWDATFALFDGVPGPADLDRLAANVPLQEAGRVSSRELTLSRANRSVRLFEHVVARLAAGAQPDREELARVGYLMRTTAVYGSGKFGAADRAAIAARPEMAGPFQAEMLTVWLIRAFTLDLVEHLAAVRGGAGATRLAPAARRSLGVGNSTGLGMAPFLVTHPVLLHRWIAARETALARVRSAPATPATSEGVAAALAAAADNSAAWTSDDPRQGPRIAALRADLARAAERLPAVLRERRPWDAFWRWGQGALSVEGQEALAACLIEPHGPLVDDLADGMAADETAAARIDGAMTVAALRRILETRYDWALATDWTAPEAAARFWYVSEEKLEPRLGERALEPGADLEQPLATGRDAARLHAALAGRDGAEPVAELLLAEPGHRHAVRRAQIAARFAYAEIRDNLVGAELVPVDLLRLKLAFFGASRFDPRSDRWLRIALFAGQPGPDEALAPAEAPGAAVSAG